ncbi:MAG TPA: hypothetical protein VKM54_19235 [Myxococcota bacterium]|nr:hypothetical protein [Myxococcota bacterium]
MQIVKRRIQREIDRLWSETAARIDLVVPSGHRFTDTIDDAESDSVAQAHSSLEPFLSILEQGIQWLACLHGSMDIAAEAERIPNSDRAPIAFIGAASAYAAAVRRLVLSGLDSPARAVARSLAESLHFAIASLHSQEIRQGIRAPQSLEEANAYWYSHLRGHRIDRILVAVEGSIGLDAETKLELRRTREAEAQWLGFFVHPSYLAAELTCKPRSAAKPGMHKVGIIGHCSIDSVHTLDAANKLIWYFARIGHVLIFRPPPFFQIDPDSEMDRMAVMGREVFSKLVINHWEEHERIGGEPDEPPSNNAPNP